MPTVVRPAEARDLSGVLELYRELRPNDPPLESDAASSAFDALLARTDIQLLVCDSNGVLTATCMLAVIPNMASGARPFGVIEHVVTLAAFRRQGHARLVLEHALKVAWAESCYKVMLLSGSHREEAHKLYESVGFVGGIERGFVAKPPSAA